MRPNTNTTVTFGMFWQVYGQATVNLPENIDPNNREAVKEWLLANWSDMPMPSGGDYIPDSDELDPENIEVEPGCKIERGELLIEVKVFGGKRMVRCIGYAYNDLEDEDRTRSAYAVEYAERWHELKKCYNNEGFFYADHLCVMAVVETDKDASYVEEWYKAHGYDAGPETAIGEQELLEADEGLYLIRTKDLF